MEKLSALDANFLYTESERMPNHISSVQMFELPEDLPFETFLEQLKAKYLERIHILPYLTRKVRFTPAQLDHPVWVKDPDFSIDRHIIPVAVAAPGGRAELEEKVGEIHAELIDRNKPLWQLFVLHGLADNHIAYYSQAHHACLDGEAGQAATLMLLDSCPEGDPIPPPPEGEDDAAASASAILNQSFANLMLDSLNTPLRLLQSMESLGRISREILSGNPLMADAFRVAPKTRFNRSIDKARTYAVADFPLDDFKQMAKSADAKVNDILLAVCAGGLRRYLERSGELPERPLIASCPVSLRAQGDTRMNNQVTMMNVALATDTADPVKRLRAIQQSTLSAKKLVQLTRDSFDPSISLLGLPATIIGSSRLLESTRLMDAMPMTTNVVISNVAGPRIPLYSNGLRMKTHYPVSIPAHGLGVNITATSYVDTFHLAITACARALPDAASLRDDILASYLQLQQVLTPAATQADSATVPRRKAAARARRRVQASGGTARRGAV